MKLKPAVIPKSLQTLCWEFIFTQRCTYVCAHTHTHTSRDLLFQKEQLLDETGNAATRLTSQRRPSRRLSHEKARATEQLSHLAETAQGTPSRPSLRAGTGHIGDDGFPGHRVRCDTARPVSRWAGHTLSFSPHTPTLWPTQGMMATSSVHGRFLKNEFLVLRHRSAILSQS